ncbi:MAG: PAS domain-containing protein [Chloroflexi bacterium]|nr:PAS domain-containing protein [Chloroflexota bacterium]MBI3340440.1 PAS domain-containing protein [Chloroflexota bacterium]
MQTPSVRNWLVHIPSLFMAGIALLMLVITPFWAARWARAPFLGLMLEPNNVVSLVDGKDWPARNSGVVFSDRLVALNGQPVYTGEDVLAFLYRNGTLPVQAGFVRRDGTPFLLEITPLKQMPITDVVTLYIVPYLVGLAFLAIGWWTYSLRRDMHASRALLAYVSGLSIITVGFFDISSTNHATVIWTLALLVNAAGLVHLALVFPKPVRFIRRWPFLRLLSWGILVLLAPRVLYILFRPTTPYDYINAWTPGYLFTVSAAIFFMGALVYRIVSSDLPLVRQQSRVIIFGALIAFLPGVIYLGPLAFGVITEFRAWLIFPALIVFPLSITYAILRYRLLDVDRFFSRALAYMLAIGAAFLFFYVMLALFSIFLQQTVHANDPFVIASYLLLLVIIFNPLRGFIQRGIDRLFYRAPADYRRALTSLSRSLVITPDLTQTLHTLESQIMQALSPEKFIIYLYNDDLGQYFPNATREDSAPAYEIEEPLIHLLASSRTPIWFPTNGPLPTLLQNSANQYQRLMGFTFVPLHYEGKLIGFMVLGPRRSGDLYTSDDLDFLAAVAAQSTLALENARLFSNLRRTLDQTMEMKNLMDDIFASVAAGIITTDLKRRITLLNHAAETILGVPVKKAIGKSLAKVIPGLGGEMVSMAEGKIKNGGSLLSAEVSHNSPERGELHLRLSVSPLRDAYLGTKGATYVFEDLTETRKLEAERELIRKTFGRVVAPRVRDRLLADPGNLELDGVKQTVTILFADLKGFTSYSEKHEPEMIFSVLNQYLSMAAQSILEQEGTLDKFMGDAVMALWNTPDQQEDHALRAARAALDILERSRNANLMIENAKQHMAFRIGITTGTAIVGNVGTSELFNYTAIGDPVNLAFRLQAAAHSGQILIEKATYDIVRDHVVASPLAPIMVKGREQAAEIYELKGLK